MVIISKKIIKEYSETRPTHTAPMERWFEITQSADWANYADMKQALIVWTAWEKVFLYSISKVMIAG